MSNLQLANATNLSVISGRSEDGTMFWCRGGMWADDLSAATMMPTKVAKRLVTLKTRHLQRQPNRWIYGLKTWDILIAPANPQPTTTIDLVQVLKDRLTKGKDL